MPFRLNRYSWFSYTRTRRLSPPHSSSKQFPQLSNRQLSSSSRQVYFDVSLSSFMPVMLPMRLDYALLQLRALINRVSFKRSSISLAMAFFTWFYSMVESILEQISTILLSIFLIFGISWLLKVFLVYSFISNKFNSFFCRVSFRLFSFNSKLQIFSYIFEDLFSSRIRLSMAANRSSFKTDSALFAGKTEGYLIFELSFRLISSICSLFSVISFLRESSWQMTSLTSFEFDDSLPIFTLILEFNPWKEFFISIPQSPQAFDFLEPPNVATSFTNVSSFSSLSLLNIWKCALNFVTSSCIRLVSLLTATQLSSFFLRALLIWETNSNSALSYLTPCYFIISAIF